MCRAYFDYEFTPKIDRGLQAQIEQQSNAQFEERKVELIDKGQWQGEESGESVLIKLVYGNQYEKVANPCPNKHDPEKMNEHRWCMFLSLENDKELTSKYITAVTYELHETFYEDKIRVTEPPFLLSRTGWG